LGFFQRTDEDKIYEKEWDVLIVLDACRFDLMKEVVNEGEYEYLRPLNDIYSAAGTSKEWMQKNFTGKYMEDARKTAMVTGNPYSDDNMDEEDFYLLEEAWRYAYDPETETVMPRPITDSAIRIHREENPEKMVIHYMQPHFPFLGRDLSDGFSKEEFGEELRKDVWDELMLDNVDRDEVWKGYKDNLRKVLEEVELLKENMDAEKMIITADHGNGLGRPFSTERFVYGHRGKIKTEGLRKVPWVEVEAEDEKNYTPEETEEDRDKEKIVKDALRDLGYNA
ncbi:MAG: hypothetical protein ABEK04_05645, partial [Candidatus Nanohalobium sp.]